MKTKYAKRIPLLGRTLVPGAAVATGLLSPMALAAPGDLDPDFGDVGRIGPILDGPAWSLETLDDGTILLAGGDLEPVCDNYYWYCYYNSNAGFGFDATNFVSLFSGSGSIDAAFIAASIDDTQVFDIARQPAGELVAVGRKAFRNQQVSRLTVFRLQADGSLDTAFATDGIFELSATDYGDQHYGTSVVLDPDGRIVVAGLRDQQLLVLRLLPDGSLDGSFGTGGVYMGPENYDDNGARTKILRVANGYRVSVTNISGCQIAAVTADGAPDNSYGVAGLVTVDAPSGPSTLCASMVLQADGRLLVAGSAAGAGFAARLMENGQADAGFSANAVSDTTASATAVAAADDGSVVVAGTGTDGASIMRLQANGALDATFGKSGLTLIDLASDDGARPFVHEVAVRPDGSVVAAGGEDLSNRPFAVRLLGAGNSPGVVGMTQSSTVVGYEGQNEVVVNVRRTGGSAGEVSVAYQTANALSKPARQGEDFTGVSGRLTWNDGDTAEREIRVPIIADGNSEEDEYFRVLLSDPQGGAGLGTRYGNVQIAPDGSPSGQFQLDPNWLVVREGEQAVFEVYRNFYSTGAVSVTLTPIAGTAAAGSDFAPGALTLSWADGESGSKTARIAIRDDQDRESAETFTVELSNPTGGAVIGPYSSARVLIGANDQPDGGRDGGGALGFFSLLLLGLARILRETKSRTAAS